ncbi:methionine--tRNA ligase [bacterium]|nr:MAG: methionine--tRNA ligase [bacterium]RIK64097.1 MAG: methionine--tRNA ligase [Planctomycetota bacterium]
MTHEHTPIYITTPLYYVNDELHIGHATTTIYADALARFWRACGRPVLFLTGSDEHGQKIYKAAQEKGTDPKSFADNIVSKFYELWERLDITYDVFIRTTDSFHERAVQELFRRARDLGFVYKGVFKSLYCVGCETYKTEKDLLNGRCPDHPNLKLEQLEEENWFFKLSAFTDKLTQLLNDGSGRVLPPSRANEILGKLREGLSDVSISRTKFDWGVRMPGDEAHVIWVWFDALINYISALGWPDAPGLPTRDLEGRSRHDAPTPAGFAPFPHWWPHSVHLVGKEILWHHSVVWWSMLMGAGLEPPCRVFAHAWWTVEGQKMSKTIGNVIRPLDYVEKYGRDALRYYVLKAGPSKEDADWRQADFIARYNADLANGLGNLVNRALNMLHKYFEGRVPAETSFADASLEGARQGLITLAQGLEKKLLERMSAFDMGDALEAIWEIVRKANQFVDESKPFKLAKDPARAKDLAAAMYAVCEICRLLGAAVEPFLPDTGARIREQLALKERSLLEGVGLTAMISKLEGQPRQSKQAAPQALLHESLRWGQLRGGHVIGTPAPLFARIETAAEDKK